LRLLFVLTFVLGGLGTYLAAVGQQPWIALTTAFVSAVAAYLGYEQIEYTVTKYSQSAITLSNIEAWWTALTSEERRDQRNAWKLVDSCEETLQAEMSGWVQQMRDALAKLESDRPQDQASDERQKRTRPRSAR